jgi:hypothetical protein
MAAINDLDDDHGSNQDENTTNGPSVVDEDQWRRSLLFNGSMDDSLNMPVANANGAVNGTTILPSAINNHHLSHTTIFDWPAPPFAYNNNSIHMA